MEEIKKLHDLNIEWGCITNLMDKICSMEEKIGGNWPELADMVIDAVSEEGANKDPASAFFNLYQFLWRVYYRVKSNPVKREFNFVTRGHGVVGSDGNTYYDPEFMIHNYDYATFRWARDNGFMDKVSNDIIIVDENKLTDKQRKAFQRRCKEVI